MNNPNAPFDSRPAEFQEEWLSAYLDEELLPAQRLVVEQRLATDPSAQQLLQEIKQIRKLVAGLPGWTGPKIMVDVQAAPFTEPKVDLQSIGSPELIDNSKEQKKISQSRGADLPKTRVRNVWLKPLALAASLLGMLGVGYWLWQGEGVSSLVAAKTGAANLTPAEQEMGELSDLDTSAPELASSLGAGMNQAEASDLPAQPNETFSLALPAGGSEMEASVLQPSSETKGALLAELPMPAGDMRDEGSLAMKDNRAEASPPGSNALVDPVRRDLSLTLPPIASTSEPPPASLSLGKGAASSPSAMPVELRFAMSSAWTEAELEVAVGEARAFLGRAVVERFRKHDGGLDSVRTQPTPPIAIARFDGHDSTEKIFSELMSENPGWRQPTIMGINQLRQPPPSPTDKQRAGSVDSQDLIALFISRQEAQEILKSRKAGQASSVPFSAALWISAANLTTAELPSDKVILLLKPKSSQ